MRDTGWPSELHYFLQKVVGLSAEDEFYPAAIQLVHAAVVAELPSTRKDSTTDVESLDPVGFERYCVDILSGHGWAAHTTRATGDQGVDVVAERDGLRVAIQCKLYSHPVGNAAGMAPEFASRKLSLLKEVKPPLFKRALWAEMRCDSITAFGGSR